MIINNFDVDFEEEGPDLRMLGGVRGIRALRVQREYLQEASGAGASTSASNTNPEILASSGGNMFSKYEEESKR